MAALSPASAGLSVAEQFALARVGWGAATAVTRPAPPRPPAAAGDDAGDPPAIASLARLQPPQCVLRAGSWLARMYFAGGRHPSQWNTFRHVGPLEGRFDHHQPSDEGGPSPQGRGILYTASSADLCLGEVFETTRRIDVDGDQPCLVVFSLRRDVHLLDLRGDWLQRQGLADRLQFGAHATAQQWAQAFYAAWPQLHGLTYRSAATTEGHAYALYERAATALPAQPTCCRALADAALLARLEAARIRLGYSLQT